MEHAEKVPKQDRLHIEIADKSNTKEETGNSDDVEDSLTQIKDQLINKVPVRYKNTAEEILSFLKRENTVLSWTPQGEILFKGTVIPRTHIVDLINSLLRKSKVRPNGQDIFFKGLKETRLPVEFDVQKKLYEKNKVVKRIMYARKLKWNKY
ncbi:hypothetical protein JTE90_018259 [Oedothorax gibbosus]|uniref:Uncharacterized protein n=1 Tax=Oedothorax gibbosus TaxID=931172 RepID=A0AAV6UAI8_9ARAC|nr:hypothetical protein JTE90_018259 [Oedothorax gibbosus]